MRKLTMIIMMIMITAVSSYGAEETPRHVTSVNVSGNPNIATEYILNVVDTKPGTDLSRDVILSDIEAIYNQGFFSFVDADINDEGGGTSVTFTVQENPKISGIYFTGNTIFTSEQLMKEVFSQEGTVFNRQFFRNDLDRIQEKYHKAGYVMVRVSDVQIQGGNIYVTGRKPDGSDWKIGVRDPSSPWGAPALVLSVHDTSVITSGGYERFKVVNGEKYTHFFDSKTGKPVKNNLLSATLVTPDGSLGDGLATAFMVGGYEKSLEIIKNLPASVGAILILQNKESKLEIFASENLRGVIVRSNYPVKFFGREVSGGSDRFF